MPNDIVSNGDETLSLEEVVKRIRTMEDTSLSAEASASHGRFVGLPLSITFEGEDGRSGTLASPITYYGPDEVEWPVPKGAWLDGASIPQIAWSIVGGPYDQPYREASVVHDHYCIIKTRRWREVHRMFHEAMLCREVSAFKARIMFYAVYRFGPRWSDPDVVGESVSPAPAQLLDDRAATSILEDAKTLQATALTIPQIEQLANSRMNRD